jgi:hypothetical protein
MAIISKITVSGTHVFMGSTQLLTDSTMSIAPVGDWASATWTWNAGGWWVGDGIAGGSILTNTTTNIVFATKYRSKLNIIANTSKLSLTVGGAGSGVITGTGIKSYNHTSTNNDDVVITVVAVSPSYTVTACELYYLLDLTGVFVWDGISLTNGELKYVSNDTFDGNTWYIAYSGSAWIMSDTAGTATANHWTASDPEGPWTAVGDASGTPVSVGGYINVETYQNELVSNGYFSTIGDYNTRNGTPANATKLVFSSIDSNSILRTSNNQFDHVMVQGMPLSASACLFETESEKFITGTGATQPINYFYALDVIVANKVSHQTLTDEERIVRLKDSMLYVNRWNAINYLNVVEFEPNPNPKGLITLFGSTMATGEYGELIFNKTSYTIDDVEEIKEVAFETGLVSVGRIGNEYYLIVTT